VLGREGDGEPRDEFHGTGGAEQSGWVRDAADTAQCAYIRWRSEGRGRGRSGGVWGNVDIVFLCTNYHSEDHQKIIGCGMKLLRSVRFAELLGGLYE